MTIKKKLILLLIPFIIVSGFMFYYFTYSNEAIEAYEVKELDAINTIVVNGKIVPAKSLQIRSPITGVVKEIKVKEGSPVEAENIMIVFETEDIENQLREIEANKRVIEFSLQELSGNGYKLREEEVNIANIQLEEAKKALDRSKELYNNKAISQREYESALTNYDLALAKYNLALINQQNLSHSGSKTKQIEAQIDQFNIRLQGTNLLLEKHSIVAPFKGKITELLIKEGEFIQVGAPLLVLEDQREFFLEVNLDEKELQYISVGQEAIISPQSYPNMRINGTIGSIKPFVDTERGTISISIKLEEANEAVITGLTASAEIITNEYKAVKPIPKRFIINDENDNYVFTMVDNKTEKIKLSIEAETSDSFIVKDGVTKGDVILLPDGIEEGQRVKPMLGE
ncbi:efflux RND transporter periplasmic adaptor subunit [Alkaliphilus pronyensis]|uniref:Efflux RND transporter periplasmic adaptor subunit n=1 Tax=Alkaliphilus pronyensis TaxID=1482732 RepID=A0A6I0FA43_9FIRM|nr:efflux RND transporter periplasmic adaptor subunit [Alkaliphilus pronyensis]KAB3539015.1 efflux RND transporter periplasmic adaptor subunit [Alkaliphilus pronyensis]